MLSNRIYNVAMLTYGFYNVQMLPNGFYNVQMLPNGFALNGGGRVYLGSQPNDGMDPNMYWQVYILSFVKFTKYIMDNLHKILLIYIPWVIYVFC